MSEYFQGRYRYSASNPAPKCNGIKKGRGIYPYPVCVATLDNGEVLRLSFWAEQGKPIDPDSATGAARAIAASRGRQVTEWRVDGAAELPARAWKVNKPTAARRVANICAALNAGDVETAKSLARAA